MSLQSINFDFIYRSGRRHEDADALSRCPLAIESDNTEDEGMMGAFVTRSNVAEGIVLDKISELLKEYDLKKAQKEDNYFIEFYSVLDNDRNQDRIKLKKARAYVLFDGILYRRERAGVETYYRLCVPKNLVPILLKSVHDSEFSGHLGRDKTNSRVRPKYFWSKIYIVT